MGSRRRASTCRAARIGRRGGLDRGAALDRRAVAGSGDLLVGYGFRDGLWPDAPTAALLDRRGDVPVVLVSGDLHAVWLELDRASRSSGHADHPTGLLREQAAFDVSARHQRRVDTRSSTAGSPRPRAPRPRAASSASSTSR